MRKEYRKLIMNTGLLAIGSFASSLLGMLLTPFYTMVLSTQDYGVSDLITTTTSLLYPFMTVAISEAIMRFALDKGTDKKSVYTIGISIVVLGFCLILCGSPFIRSTAIGEYFGFFLLYYLSYAMHTITSYFVKGLEKVKIYSVAGLINSGIVICANLLFLLVFEWGIVGYLLASILGHSFTTLFLFFGAKAYQHIIAPWKIDRVLLKNMLVYSIPIIPNSLSWWVANSSDKYMLNYFTDVSQVGIYSVSYKIPSIVMTLMGLFISAWQLSAVEDFGSEKSKRFYSEVYSKCFACNLLIAAGLICIAKPFGAFLYSSDFFVAWRYVPVLVIANVFNVLSSFMGTVYTSAKKTKMLSLSTMIGAGANIAMNLILIPSIGALGAALATAASYFVMWVIRLINTRRIIRFPIAYKKDGIMLGLLFLEAALIYMDTVVTSILAVIILVLLMTCYRRFIIDIVKQVWNGIVSKTSKNSKHPVE